MTTSFRCLRAISARLLAAIAAIPAFAQTQPFVHYKGKTLPMIAYGGVTGKVIDEGKRVDASADFELRPAATFFPGITATVSQMHADLDPTRDLTPVQRAAPSLVRFRYEADITSSQPIKDAFGMLTSVANGSVETNFVYLGTLTPDRSRHVKIEIRHRVETVGKFHVYGGGGGAELMSNEISAPYNAADYFARLVQGSRGVSAAALCKTEESFPNSLSDNGDLLATIRERDTHKSLIIYDLKAGKVLHDIKLGDTGETAWDLTWISDHELVYVSMENKMSHPTLPSSQTYLTLLDTATGKAERLQQGVSRIFSSLKKNRTVLVVFGSGWQYHTGTAKYDIRKRQLGPVKAIEVGTTYFDDNG